MKWITEHFQLILAIAGAIAYWLNQQRTAAADEAEEKKNAQPASMAEADDAMRAEQVRAEIRRKIAERRGEAAEPAPAGGVFVPEPAARKIELPPLLRPRPVTPLDPFGGPARPVFKRAEPVAAPVPAAVAPDATPEAELVRQEELAARLRELAEQRALVARRATAVSTSDAAVARAALAGDELRHDLRDPRSLRRAVILREVLGVPVGLR
jgi:hypothetical protein